MAALDFPAAPTAGDTYEANGRTWVWNGETWRAQPRKGSVGTRTLNLPASPSTNDLYTHEGWRWQWTGETWQSYGPAVCAAAAEDADWDDVLFYMTAQFEPGTTEFFDESEQERTISAGGGGEVVSSIQLLGENSVNLPSTNSRLSVTASFTPPSGGTWTFECVVYFNSVTSSQDICSQWQSAAGQRGFLLRFENGTPDQLQLLYSTTGSDSVTIAGNWSPSINTAYHIRVTQNGTAISLDVDNVQVGSGTLSAAIFDSPQAFRIGNHLTAGGGVANGLLGRIGAVRITEVVRSGAVSAMFPRHGQRLSAAYSWWSHPLALVMECDTLLGFVDVNGDACVAKLDTDTGVMEKKHVLNDNFAKDDHNAPAIQRLGNDKLLVAYTGHLDDDLVYYRIADDFDGIAAAAESSLATSAVASYVQLFAYGSNAFLVTRPAATGRAWGIFRSTDNGATWGSQQNFVDMGSNTQMYVLARQNGKTLRCLVTRNGADADNHIRVMDIDLSTGSATSGGTSLGNIDGSSEGGNTLPATFSSLATLLSAGASETLRLLDLSDDGEAFIYASTVAGTTTYKVAYLTGANPHTAAHWTHRTITTAGAFFYAASEYPGGCVFDRRDRSNQSIYVATETGGTRKLELWVTANQGTSWSDTDITTGTLVIRPLVPVGVDGASLPVLWQTGAYTNFNTFTLDTRW